MKRFENPLSRMSMSRDKSYVVGDGQKSGWFFAIYYYKGFAKLLKIYVISMIIFSNA